MSRKLVSLIVVITFICSVVTPIPKAQAQNLLGLPEPGTMVSLSPAYEPALIKGLTVHKDNPFLFDFIIDTGRSNLTGSALKQEGDRLIKYFFAALTIPDKDLWVNLSPYEKDRMVPLALGKTALGRDLLAQDYMLKQLTASLIYPEKELGRNFWDKVYAQAREQFGTTDIPVNTFNKVWIIAEKASVYEHNQTAFVVSGHLKVMLEEDYLSLIKHTSSNRTTSSLSSQIIRSIILPALEHEVNTGKNFSTLRQIFYSQILATWFKRNLQEALLSQLYADKSTVNGVNLQDPSIKEKIYQRYLQAYKKGAFNFIKEDLDPITQQSVPRKYFSGGLEMAPQIIDKAEQSEARRSAADMASVVDAKVMLNTGTNPAMVASKVLRGTAILTEYYARPNYFNSRPLIEYRPDGDANWTTGQFFSIDPQHGMIFFDGVGFNYYELPEGYYLDNVEIRIPAQTLSLDNIRVAAAILLGVVTSSIGKTTGHLKRDQKGEYFTEGDAGEAVETKDLLARLAPRWLDKDTISNPGETRFYLPSRIQGAQDWIDMINELHRVIDQGTLDAAMMPSRTATKILRGAAEILQEYHSRPDYFANQPLIRFRPIGGTDSDWTAGLFFTINDTKRKIFFESVGFNEGEKMVPHDLDKIEIEVGTLSPEQVQEAAEVLLGIINSNTGRSGALEIDRKGTFFTEGAIDQTAATKELLARLILENWLSKEPILSSNWHKYYLPSENQVIQGKQRKTRTQVIREFAAMNDYLNRVKAAGTLDAAMETIITGQDQIQKAYSSGELKANQIVAFKMKQKEGEPEPGWETARFIDVILFNMMVSLSVKKTWKDHYGNDQIHWVNEEISPEDISIRFIPQTLSYRTQIITGNEIQREYSKVKFPDYREVTYRFAGDPESAWRDATLKRIDQSRGTVILQVGMTEEEYPYNHIYIKRFLSQDLARPGDNPAMITKRAVNDNRAVRRDKLEDLVQPGYTIIFQVKGDTINFTGKVEAIDSQRIRVDLRQADGEGDRERIETFLNGDIILGGVTVPSDMQDNPLTNERGRFNQDYAQTTKGGIDLNTLNNGLSVSKDANGGVTVFVDPAMIERIRHEGIERATPVIINMKFLPSVDQLLGL